jgi:hypothetical protein
VGERLRVDAWYGGSLMEQDLPARTWKIEDDSTRQVRRALTVAIQDPDGLLVPLDYGDTLASAGQRLAMQYLWPTGESLALGEVQISGSHPASSWVRSAHEGAVRLVSGGASIEVTARDLTDLLGAADLESPQAPESAGTYESEILRLCDGIVPVVIDPGVDASGTVNSSTVYDTGTGSRLNAVEDLAGACGAVLRMGNDAALHVTTVSTDPVWEIAGGDEGVLINIDYEMSIDDLYNACISTSSGADTEIVGRYRETTGLLRWDGPMGRRPMFHDSPLITSQAMADKDAETTLKNKIAARSIPVKITCLDHPGLQSGDWVWLALPQDGEAADTLRVACPVQSLTRNGSEQGTLPMEMTVMMTLSSLRAALRGLSAGSL